MGFALPNGAQVYLASDYETALPFTAITNAAHAVLTVVGNDKIKKDDLVHLSSGWTGLNERVARVSAATATSLTLENIDTRQTTQFVAGGGAGSLRKIKTWTEIPQIKEVASSGGDQQTVSLQFLSDTVQRNINTVKAPRTLTIPWDMILLWRFIRYYGRPISVRTWSPSRCSCRRPKKSATGQRRWLLTRCLILKLTPWKRSHWY
ncbi:phage tail protein [Candidatus Fukatsuia symbiotica]|nr:phage tail protein [Candidatus Fukatsuia symbiotica]MEA9444457.1 phage tail protein [Candidatus Fukatsuia symbiotica]